MSIEVGAKYQLSDGIKSFYNSADSLTVIRQNGISVQFTLGEGKGYGSMPVQHFHYLLKRSDLSKVKSKRLLIDTKDTEENIS